MAVFVDADKECVLLLSRGAEMPLIDEVRTRNTDVGVALEKGNDRGGALEHSVVKLHARRERQGVGCQGFCSLVNVVCAGLVAKCVKSFRVFGQDGHVRCGCEVRREDLGERV